MEDRDQFNVISLNDTPIEVKFSNFLRHGESKTPRWRWSRLLGNSGRNEYDRLICVGAYVLQSGDEDYRFFDFPYSWVRKYLRTHGSIICLPGKIDYEFWFHEVAPESLTLRYGRWSTSDFLDEDGRFATGCIS